MTSTSTKAPRSPAERDHLPPWCGRSLLGCSLVPKNWGVSGHHPSQKSSISCRLFAPGSAPRCTHASSRRRPALVSAIPAELSARPPIKLSVCDLVSWFVSVRIEPSTHIQRVSGPCGRRNGKVGVSWVLISGQYGIRLVFSTAEADVGTSSAIAKRRRCLIIGSPATGGLNYVT